MTRLAKHDAWIQYFLHSDGQTSPSDVGTVTIAERDASSPRHYCCPSGQQLPKAEAHLHYGAWLGKSTQSDEHYVGSAEGVIRTRDINRLPKSGRYQVDYFRNVVGAPWQPRRPEADYLVFVLPNPPADVPAVPHEPLNRDSGAPPTAGPEGTTGESGVLPRTRGGDDGAELPPTGRRCTSPFPGATTDNLYAACPSSSWTSARHRGRQEEMSARSDDYARR